MPDTCKRKSRRKFLQRQPKRFCSKRWKWCFSLSFHITIYYWQHVCKDCEVATIICQLLLCSMLPTAMVMLFYVSKMYSHVPGYQKHSLAFGRLPNLDVPREIFYLKNKYLHALNAFSFCFFQRSFLAKLFPRNLEYWRKLFSKGCPWYLHQNSSRMVKIWESHYQMNATL